MTLIVFIYPQKLIFPASEPVYITGALVNLSSKGQYAFWNTCGEQYEIYIDSKEIYNNHTGIMCAIGANYFKPFTADTKEYKLDTSKLSIGLHSMYVHTNKKYSNTTYFWVTGGESVKNCYEHTKDITTACKQIAIRTNIFSADASENNERCQRIKTAFIENTALRPITKLSTSNCDTGDAAYFVMNVPTEDYQLWENKFAQVGHSAEVFLNIEYKLLGTEGK